MKKYIVLALCLLTFLSMLTACGSGNSESGFTGVDHSNRSVSTSALTSQTLDPTTNEPPNNGKEETPTTATGENAISMNALVGVWLTRGWSDVYWLEFGTNGNFAYYRGTISASVNYWNEYYMKGKYRTNGNVVECYDCQFDSFEETSLSGNVARNHRYFDNYKRLDMPDNLLIETRLQDPKNADNFSIMFEFIDSMTLRIIKDGGSINMEFDDCDFNYHADSHNVAIPTHSIPGVEWPKDMLPPDLPEYINGRIRSVYPLSEPGYTVDIRIDQTTLEDIRGYADSLIQAGWTSAYGDNDLKRLIDGEGGTYYFNNREMNYSCSIALMGEEESRWNLVSIVY